MARFAPFALMGSLAACGAPPAQASRSAPEPVPSVRAPGPVNPDPRVTRYRCQDGQTIVAGYPDASTAVVTYKDHVYTLKRVISGSGVRYTGFGLQWWTKGPRAALAALKPSESVASDPGLVCFAGDAQPG